MPENSGYYGRSGCFFFSSSRATSLPLFREPSERRILIGLSASTWDLLLYIKIEPRLSTRSAIVSFLSSLAYTIGLVKTDSLLAY